MRINLFDYEDLNIELHPDDVSYCLPDSNDRIKVKDSDKDMYTMYALADDYDDKIYRMLLKCFDYEFSYFDPFRAYLFFALKIPFSRNKTISYCPRYEIVPQDCIEDHIDSEYFDKLCARYKRIVLPYLHKKHDEIHNPHVSMINSYIPPTCDTLNKGFGYMMRKLFIEEQLELLKKENNETNNKINNDN